MKGMTIAMRRKPRRPLFAGINPPRFSEKQRGLIKLAAIILAVLFIFISSSRYLRELTRHYAMTQAHDHIVYNVNDIIKQKMSAGNYNYNTFVNLEKDSSGAITALTTNMVKVNSVSAEITKDIAALLQDGELDLRIPFGNLTGSNLVSGRGPKIPIKVIMLSSPEAAFHNELTSAGINQTKHQIILTVTIKTNILIPWSSISDDIKTDVLIAETVIVGKVPDSYIDFNYGDKHDGNNPLAP